MLLRQFTSVLLLIYTVNAKSKSSQSDHASLSFYSLVKEGIQRDIDSRCLDCIWQTESNCNHSQGCNPNPAPNGEIACGAYNIRKRYFQDCCQILGDIGNCDSNSAWQNCAMDYNCATRCVQAYVNEYGPSCSGQAKPTCDVFSRVHNGGPNGCRNANTTGYWNDVQRCYGDHNPYLYPCTLDSDCTNSLHHCLNAGSDPNGWLCNCRLPDGSCLNNADCCNNMCQDGNCAEGGLNGAVCMIGDLLIGCSSECQCVEFENYGYCECS